MSKIISLTGKDTPLSPGIKKLQKIPAVKELILLPDVGTSSQEMPVSTVLAAKKSIVAGTPSNVINCGVQAIITDIPSNVNPELLTTILHQFMKHCQNQNSLSKKELDNILLSGLDGLAEKKKLTSKEVSAFENKGKITVSESLWSTVPLPLRYHPVTKNISYTNFRGNHFLEIHHVKTIDANHPFNNKIAFLMHTDGVFSQLMNWNYFYREKSKKMKPLQKFVLNSSKILHQFILNPSNFNEKIKLYFGKEMFPVLQPNSNEYARYASVIAVGMNYGYAHRAKLYLNLRDAIHTVFENAKVNLLTDRSHDSIQQEGEYWVSRKGCSRVYKDEYAILLGNKDMNSKLCVGIAQAEKYRNSFDHGTSNYTELFPRKNIDKKTLCMRWDRNKQELIKEKEVKHQNPTAVDSLSKKLNENNILKEIATLEPMMNLKEKQKGNPFI